MKYFYLLILFFAGQFLIAQTGLSDELIQNIEKRVEYQLNPSIAIGFIDENGPQYYSFGHQTIDGRPVDEHSIYEIGSISKVFTGILLADMVEKGQMSVDDPISKYLPDGIDVPTFNGKHITLGHLSDHTSSLPRMPDNFDPADRSNPYADYTVEQLYEFLSSVELTREIGSEYEYSNYAQGLLGHILALKAGMSYEELLSTVITESLGLSETKVTLDDHMKRNLAIGHNNGVEVSNWDIATLTGAGGIRSSVHDMVEFLSANLGYSKTPLKKAMNLSHEIRHDKGGNGSVGLGWHVIEHNDRAYIAHSGGTGGYRAFAAMDKEAGKGVVVLTNSTRGADDIARYIMDPDSELDLIKRDGSLVLRKIINEEGIEKAEEAYRELKSNNPDEYEFNESAMNNLGYQYMPDNLDAALLIFSLNIEEHPEAFNTYDSYAEALRNQSITFYKKSIELNPGNDNGYEMLKQMGVDLKKKEVIVADEILDLYVGNYQLAPTFFIEITREENRLFAQATGQDRFELFPSSDSEFYLKVVEARIEFHKNDEGVIESLTLYQGGQEMPGAKVE